MAAAREVNSIRNKLYALVCEIELHILRLMCEVAILHTGAEKKSIRKILCMTTHVAVYKPQYDVRQNFDMNLLCSNRQEGIYLGVLKSIIYLGFRFAALI